MANDVEPVRVSRRISADARDIFRILADPARHPDLDGSGMLRGAEGNAVVSGVGDSFITRMHQPALGDYEMSNLVVEYELDRRIGWEPNLRGTDREADSATRNGSRWSFELTPDGPGATVVTEIFDCSGSPEHVRAVVDNGDAWVASMTKTLERLDALCTNPGPTGR
jgi:hypothetical protein